MRHVFLHAYILIWMCVFVYARDHRTLVEERREICILNIVKLAYVCKCVNVCVCMCVYSRAARLAMKY